MILYSSPDLLAMWLVLQKYGILGVMTDLVRVLQDNMGAEPFVAGESARIHVSNGLCVGTNSVLAVFQYGHVMLVR